MGVLSRDCNVKGEIVINPKIFRFMTLGGLDIRSMKSSVFIFISKAHLCVNTRRFSHFA